MVLRVARPVRPMQAELEFIDRVIGQPYEDHGLHCWELTRQCQREVFGRELPVVLDAPAGLLAKVRLMRQRHAFEGWRQVDGPAHGAVVFLTLNGHGAADGACHSGTWLDLDGGAVLHTDRGHGVVFEGLAELAARNWAELSFHLPA
jgi:hypothetical protein